MKLVSKIKEVLTGARSQADALKVEADQTEAAYQAALTDIAKLRNSRESLVLQLSKESRSQKSGESRDTYAQRMWALGQSERMVKDLDRQIADGQARLGEIEAERARLRQERKDAARTVALAGTDGGAEAIATLDAAKRTLADLNAKAEAFKTAGESLSAERAEIALAAHGGDDPAATERLGEINSQLVRHNVETDGIAAAIEQAKLKVESAQAAVSHQETLRKANEVARISRLIIAEAAAADQALEAMVAALRHRRELIREMANIGVNKDVTNHLLAKMAVNRALAKAGLKDFADFDAGGHVSHVRSLADHDATFIGGGSTTTRAA